MEQVKAGYIGKIEESELIDGLSISYLKYSGVWEIINTYRVAGEKNVMLKIGMLITIIFLCPFIILSLMGCFFDKADLQAVTLFVLNPLSCFQSLSKVLVFWFGLKSQCELIDIFKRDFLSCVPESKLLATREIMRKIAVKTNYFCLAGIGANSLCVFVWNFMPIVRSQYFREELHIVLDTVENKGPNKILGGWYPFEYTKSPWSQIVYVYEFIVCAWAGFVISIHECILLQLVMMVYAHTNVVSYIISNLNKSDFFVGDSNNDSAALDDRMYEHLLKCVKDHQKLMNIGDELRNLYNFLITSQLGTGLLIMIITVFNFLDGPRDPLFTVKFLVYLAYEMVEIVLYCYSGAFLESASSDIGFAVYSSEWYRSQKRYRLTGQMLMVRSHHPMSLIAVQMYPVNLQTLANLLQLTYSASAVLSRSQ